MAYKYYLPLIIGMGLVTYLPRWLPLFFLSDRKISDGLSRWLGLIPVAILSALLAPALLTMGDPRQLSFARPELIAALPTFIFALKTRSLGGTVLVGMGVFWLLERM